MSLEIGPEIKLEPRSQLAEMMERWSHVLSKTLLGDNFLESAGIKNIWATAENDFEHEKVNVTGSMHFSARTGWRYNVYKATRPKDNRQNIAILEYSWSGESGTRYAGILDIRNLGNLAVGDKSTYVLDFITLNHDKEASGLLAVLQKAAEDGTLQYNSYPLANNVTIEK